MAFYCDAAQPVITSLLCASLNYRIMKLYSLTQASAWLHALQAILAFNDLKTALTF